MKNGNVSNHAKDSTIWKSYLSMKRLGHLNDLNVFKRIKRVKYLMLSAKKAKRKGRAYEFANFSKENRAFWKFLLKKKNVVRLLRGS